MKKFTGFMLLFFATCFQAQIFNGEILINDYSNFYLNQVFVTNLNTHKTVLSNIYGSFSIEAKTGDVIRFTSIVTDRKDFVISDKNFQNSNNIIELKVAYHDIEEVVITNFKPSGNLRKDLAHLKTSNKKEQIRKAVGLPLPKGDGTSPENQIAALKDGGLTFSVEAIYDALSGERKKKERLYAYEKMKISIANIKSYYGVEYFTNLRIPVNLIDNFLQFVYSSDNLIQYLDNKNMESISIYIEKYLPIYHKRLRNSNLIEQTTINS